MKQGTISVLVGCHSVIHSILVLRAWRHLYGRWPAFWQFLCIFIHDIGHWGRDYLNDYEQKKVHWVLGAKVAGVLFGFRGFVLVAGHCRYNGFPESPLYKADKYSWIYEPYWWAWWNGLVEPKLRMGYSMREAYDRFHAQVKENVESGEYRPTHDMYLERCRELEERD